PAVVGHHADIQEGQHFEAVFGSKLVDEPVVLGPVDIARGDGAVEVREELHPYPGDPGVMQLDCLPLQRCAVGGLVEVYGVGVVLVEGVAHDHAEQLRIGARALSGRARVGDAAASATGPGQGRENDDYEYDIELFG